ncbi:MAG: hypothetical protein A3K19_18735 [Lentisphaerae bacterium RIFOXYB12_FULL_65_16]|nr:MAG: hypothetical protein A3K18_26185 [Lentisphaerae bacterium RIFOXYA12_64_32]OGV92460.1 MAG: hypothetical protein A3K19_18735 [Lentisphaerae bacterium RIFOXYB12_FULL_65_16]
MHIPDGFLDARIAAASGVLALAGVGVALRTVKRTVPPRRVPLIGLAAAFVFAAQMLNFPVAGGTSGHVIGAVLVAVLLGPEAAVLAMTAVLVLQCFMFADGGVTALGANVFDMALVAPVVGYTVYALAVRLAGTGLRSRLFATAFAAWCSTVAAATCCAGQLALSGAVAPGAAFPAMAGVHMLIGIGEALITTMVIATVAGARPELLTVGGDEAELPRYCGTVVTGLIVSLGLAVFVAPFACGWPDGLEKVAVVLGFAPRAAEQPLIPSPLPDYAVPGVSSAFASTAVAGGVGTVIAFVLAWILARALTPRPASVCAGETRKESDRA